MKTQEASNSVCNRTEVAQFPLSVSSHLFLSSSPLLGEFLVPNGEKTCPLMGAPNMQHDPTHIISLYDHTKNGTFSSLNS